MYAGFRPYFLKAGNGFIAFLIVGVKSILKYRSTRENTSNKYNGNMTTGKTNDILFNRNDT
jgi:hypothetical protein